MNVQYFVHELPYTVVLLYLYVFYNLHLNSCVHSFVLYWSALLSSCTCYHQCKPLTILQESLNILTYFPPTWISVNNQIVYGILKGNERYRRPCDYFTVVILVSNYPCIPHSIPDTSGRIKQIT